MSKGAATILTNGKMEPATSVGSMCALLCLEGGTYIHILFKWTYGHTYTQYIYIYVHIHSFCTNIHTYLSGAKFLSRASRSDSKSRSISISIPSRNADHHLRCCLSTFAALLLFLLSAAVALFIFGSSHRTQSPPCWESGWGSNTTPSCASNCASERVQHTGTISWERRHLPQREHPRPSASRNGATRVTVPNVCADTNTNTNAPTGRVYVSAAGA